jgi:iron complex transport system substrate-binding protein
MGREVRRRDLIGFAAGAVAALVSAPRPATARALTDSGGRKVEVPDRVGRVFPAGPPASVTLFAVAPEKMLGWTRSPSPQAQAFLPPQYARLPEIGRLTGRGNTANLETVVRLRPDLVLDVGDPTATYASLANRVQQATHIPYVLIGGRLAETPTTLRAIGSLLGVAARAEALAAYADATISRTRRRVSKIPPANRPSIYVARGPRGLETAVGGSIGSEVVDMLGARNVVSAVTVPKTIVEVSPEQVLAWQPDVMLAVDRRFRAIIGTDPVWRQLDAVRKKRVHFVPDLPFSWLDEPPGLNRLIGLAWLGSLLYPSLFPEDIRAEARRFYAFFYGQQPSDAQLVSLLANPPA